MTAANGKNAASTPLLDHIDVQAPRPTAGGVVIGGDYQGLGIVRSLGRQGIPVCVVDDELSISRYSRYTKKFVRVESLRDERAAVDTLIAICKAGYSIRRAKNW
jgi:predicted ATP-grasp superfamily ATP-dependent carboligase